MISRNIYYRSRVLLPATRLDALQVRKRRHVENRRAGAHAHLGDHLVHQGTPAFMNSKHEQGLRDLDTVGDRGPGDRFEIGTRGMCPS